LKRLTGCGTDLSGSGHGSVSLSVNNVMNIWEKTKCGAEQLFEPLPVELLLETVVSSLE
jgi:hypothetical protein